jgi:hypothetical protein
MKSAEQTAAALETLIHFNYQLNADKPYPAHSLHARGHLVPSCNFCSVIVALSWVLGVPDPAGNLHEFPYFTDSERAALLAEADKVASARPAGANINTW